MYLNLENGKTFVINAPDNNIRNNYISGLKLNGIDYSKNYLNHSDIINGGKMDLKMSDEPNKQRGNKQADFPYSMTKDKN
jgi:putative alpha-1,2-mannosidase